MTHEEIVQHLVEHFTKGKNPEQAGEITDEITSSLEMGKGRWASFGEDKVGIFKADGDEYCVILSDADAEKIAIALNTQTLEDEPELFSQNFIKQYIKMTPTDIRIVSGEEADASMDGMRDEDIIDEVEMQDEYESADDAGKEKILKDAKDKIHDSRYEKVKAQLEKNPLKYFTELGYSVEDALKVPVLRVDVDKAAKASTDIDGWAHYLSLYDGESEEIGGGLVVFRED